MKTEETLPPTYLPTVKEAEIISDTYKKLRDMMDLKIKTMPHFSGPEGDRSFLQYIDDSERILNGWTPSRESQGRDSWESNIIDNITRVKLRTIVTAVGLNVPAMKFKATSANGIQSSQRSEIMKQTVRHTFLQGNPTMQAFLELWQMMAHGVTFVYDGYLSGGMKRKVVTGFNSETGEVETEEKYVKVDGRPFNAILDPQDFFWWDFYKRDIQDQPHLAWLERYQIEKSTTLNLLVNKLYRSVVKPYLVGLVNKDVLDIESEIISQDSRIYVPDIDQVKPWPAEGVNQSELAMLAAMDRSIDLLSVDV